MIGKAIYEILRSNPAFSGISISPLRSMQSLPMPCVTYIIGQTDPSMIKVGPSPLDTIGFVITVFAEEYKTVEQLAVEVRASLDQVCGIYGEVLIQKMVFLGSDDGYDEDAEMYGMSIDFQARIDRSYNPDSYDYATLDYSENDYFVSQ